MLVATIASKTKLLSELSNVANKYLTDDAPFPEYLSSLDQKIATDANFFEQDSFKDTLDELIIQFIQRFQETSAVYRRASYEMQLTLSAIKLELLSVNKSCQEKNALKRHADQLRAMRDNTNSPIVAIDYTQLEALSLGVLAELEEMIANYEAELKNLKNKAPNFPILSYFTSQAAALLTAVERAAFQSTGLLQ